MDGKSLLLAAIVFIAVLCRIQAICGGDLVQEKGTLQSPNYPFQYPPNTECTWRITVPENHHVALKFQYFEIQDQDNCEYDYLEIRDGHESTSHLLGRFCGDSIPEDIRSSGNKMSVKFVSDRAVQKAGFAADFIKELKACKEDHGCEHECTNTLRSYRCKCRIGYELHSDGKKCEDKDECATNNGGCQHFCKNKIGSYACFCLNGFLLHENLHDCKEDACGGVIEETSGRIISPSFPAPYPPNKICIWEIIAPPQYRITLNFTHFDLEGDNQDCEYDSVNITSKIADDEVRMHGLFCGSRLPPLIISEGNSLRIDFNSDKSLQKSGFGAYFFTDKDECATNNGGCQQICKNTIGSYACSCLNGFVLYENLHDCKEDACGGVIEESNGRIISPSFPDPYPPNKICIWEIIAPPQYRITLNFTHFDLEGNNAAVVESLDTQFSQFHGL